MAARLPDHLNTQNKNVYLRDPVIIARTAELMKAGRYRELQQMYAPVGPNVAPIVDENRGSGRGFIKSFIFG